MKIPRLIKLMSIWDTLRTSYWFVPTMMAAAAVLLWTVVYTADVSLDPKRFSGPGWIYTGGPEGARELLGVVAASMMTVTGVTFSITVVALTLASQQFGPFLLRNFMRDTGNQVVLGTFLSTFIFCLLTLRIIRGTDALTFVPHLSVSASMLLTLASLGVLIYFIHHIAVSMQVSTVISVVSADMQQAIDRLFPEELGGEGASPAKRHELPPETGAAVTSSGYGYIKAVDDDALLAAATEHALVVQLLKRPGDFVGKGDRIASAWPAASLTSPVARQIEECLLLGSQRTATQDVAFVFDQMVEIAVRALSPGINDPFTAMICIDHLGQGLRRMAGREIPSPFRYADGALRVIAYGVTFTALADTAFGTILHYGRSSPLVLIRLLRTIAAIAPHAVRDEDRHALLRHAVLARDFAREALLEQHGGETLDEIFAGVVSLLGKEGIE